MTYLAGAGAAGDVVIGDVVFLVGAVVDAGLALAGWVKTSPMVLRCAASGEVGINKEPRWPQAVKDNSTQIDDMQVTNKETLFLLPCLAYELFIVFILLPNHIYPFT
jgi:hypothetical protein